MRLCPRCKEEKEPKLFYSSGYCRPCNNERSKEWYASNLEARKTSVLKYYYRKKYGLTLDDIQAMHSSQNGECSVCNVSIHLDGTLDATQACIDHDHKTNIVRGMLCNLCNQGLGHFRDNPAYLRSAAKYLETRY